MGPVRIADSSLHHKLFDLGAIGLTTDRRITVSQRFVGRADSTGLHVTALSGRAMYPPQAGSAHIAADHIAWHRREVFQGEPRPPA